jgi:CRISPR-associated protein Cas5d
MKYSNSVDFKVSGKYALFTDPITKIGGEKCSYHIPTYEALKGVISSVYWKPTIIWVIDKVRVMNRIKTQTKGVKPIDYLHRKSSHTLSIYTYLEDVEYQVQAHFEWNPYRPDLEKDRNEHKHFWIAKRMIERGGRRDVFLGTRECQGYVEPCKFGEGESFYDNYGPLKYDLMFHGFNYPDEHGNGKFEARFWQPSMDNGIIEFDKPEDCRIKRLIRGMKPNPPETAGLEEEGLLDGYKEETK